VAFDERRKSGENKDDCFELKQSAEFTAFRVCGEVCAPPGGEPLKEMIGGYHRVSLMGVVAGWWPFIGCAGSVLGPETAVAFQ
jgi:hypothetical protein